MPLSSGTRLGSYEIVAPLGAGGMGEVYRGRGLRLGREVALEVLPADVASDAGRLARPEREARIVAGLHHPNIVTLFSVEDEDGVRFLTILVIAMSRALPRAASEDEPRRAGAVIAFGLLWTAAGWAILFLPSIGWHSYYGVLGSLGCWLVIGTALRRHLGTAVSVVLVVATLREARAATPSWDWGTGWYQQRAGNLLGAIRDRLFELHPELPVHSRIFLARIPNNIGLLAGDGPAIRVWDDDPTRKAGYYSSYTPRLPGETSGADYFLRFDTLQALSGSSPELASPALRPHSLSM